MTRGLLRDTLLSLLIVSILAPSVALAQSGLDAEGNFPGDRGFNQETATGPDGRSTTSANPLTVGAIGGISSCIAVALTVKGAGLQKVAEDLATTVIPITSVPAYDIPVHLNLASQVRKDDILKCIAGALVKAVIRELTKSIVNWANNGFNGKPVFVQDLGKFLLDIGDKQIGEFIYGSSALAGLCSPFALKVRIMLARSVISRPVQCTLTKVIKNLQSFAQNFQNGGWPAWLELTTVTTNNPYGAFLVAKTQLDQRIATEQALAAERLRYGNGFLSVEVCLARSSSGLCLRQQTITPGTVIASQLNKALGNQWDVLNLSQDIASLIDGLMVALLNRLFTSNSGLAGLGSTFSGGGFGDPKSPPPPPSTTTPTADDETRKTIDLVASQIESAISFEQKVIDVKNQTKDAIQDARNRLTDLANCYDQKLGSGSGSLTPEQRATAENRKANANLTGQALLPRISPLDKAISSSTATIVVLEGLRTQAFNAPNQTVATKVLTDFYQARALGKFSSEFATIEAQRELDAARLEMQQLNQSTDEKLNECFAFPNNP